MKIHSFILGIFLILCLNVNAQNKLEIEGCYFNSKNIEFKAKFPSKFKNLCNPNRTISHYITSQGHDIFYLKPPYYIIHPIHLTSEKYIGEVVDSLNDIIRKEIFMDVQREMKYTTIYKFINTYSKKNNNGKYSFDYLYGEHIASYFVSSQYDWVVDIKESELNDALTFLKDKIYFYEVSIKNKLKNNNKSDEKPQATTSSKDKEKPSMAKALSGMQQNAVNTAKEQSPQQTAKPMNEHLQGKVTGAIQGRATGKDGNGQ